MTRTNIKKTVTAAAILLITGFFAVQAFAYMSGGGYHRGGGYGMMNNGGHMGYGSGHMNGYGMNQNGHMWNNLTREEQSRLQNRMDQFRSSTKNLRDRYYQTRQELNRAYADPRTDRATIEQLNEKLVDISSELEQKRLNHRADLRNEFGGRIGGFHGGMARGYGGCY